MSLRTSLRRLAPPRLDTDDGDADTADESKGTDPPFPTAVHAALRGLGGGLVATAVMSVYRLPIFRGLPPTAEFWATYVGLGEAEQFPLVGWLLHFLYGGVGGTVFGLLFQRIDFGSERERRIGGTLLAFLYGAFLSVFGSRVLFPLVLDEDMDADEAFVFHVGHLVYGLTLGTWLTSRERPGEVYD